MQLQALPPGDLRTLENVGVAPTGAYIALAGAIISFGITFGIIPQFSSFFKEEKGWRDIYLELQELGGVPSISPAEAVEKAGNGVALLDVRMARLYEQGYMPHSINVPLYKPISGWGLPATIRRAGFAFFGIYGTELNQHWLEDVKTRISPGSQVLVVCNMGGDLTAKAGATTGFQSQSLKAAHQLLKAGYKVFHVKGGVSEYERTCGSSAKEESRVQP